MPVAVRGSADCRMFLCAGCRGGVVMPCLDAAECEEYVPALLVAVALSSTVAMSLVKLYFTKLCGSSMRLEFSEPSLLPMILTPVPR